MDSICTTADLQRITGRKRRSAQQRWLDQHGWTYLTNAAGQILLSRAHVETQLNPPLIHNTPQAFDQPDWSYFDGA